MWVLNPLCIVLFIFPATHVLRLLRIDKVNIKSVFNQHSKQRLPINTSTFHRNRVNTTFMKPPYDLKQITSHCSK